MSSFEYRATPDEIVHLDTGQREKAWRFQYRRPGVHRWTRFLLVQDAAPSPEETEALLRAHEAERAAGRRG